jgi:hypothetical protein
MTTTTTLLKQAELAERGKPRDVHIIDGSMRNGRTEKWLRVLGLINGCVAVEQGLTGDVIFLLPDHAAAITVRKA